MEMTYRAHQIYVTARAVKEDVSDGKLRIYLFLVKRPSENLSSSYIHQLRQEHITGLEDKPITNSVMWKELPWNPSYHPQHFSTHIVCAAAQSPPKLLETEIHLSAIQMFCYFNPRFFALLVAYVNDSEISTSLIQDLRVSTAAVTWKGIYPY